MILLVAPAASRTHHATVLLFLGDGWPSLQAVHLVQQELPLRGALLAMHPVLAVVRASSFVAPKARLVLKHSPFLRVARPTLGRHHTSRVSACCCTRTGRDLHDIEELSDRVRGLAQGLRLLIGQLDLYDLFDAPLAQLYWYSEVDSGMAVLSL